MLSALILLVHLAAAEPPVFLDVDKLPPAPSDPIAARGAWLYRVAACIGCHSPPYADGQHLAGGRHLPTMFGTFYAPNISKHPTDGIGAWTEADFERAMRLGRAPDGHAYWPTFPYTAYTDLSDEDVHALWVYLQSQPAVAGQAPPHEVAPRYRSPGLLGLWRLIAFHPRRTRLSPANDPEVARGEYLVRAVSYCDQCHSPRNRSGLLLRRHDLAGGANPGKSEIHPNLTPDPTVGIGAWSADDLVRFLQTGEKPDGTRTVEGWIMDEKIQHSFAYYSEPDLRAIAAFLQSLPPDDFDPALRRW
jgi:mono/diheme cytochrome c family protein